MQKPARYTGGEWGSVRKDPEKMRIRFAFCFPDTYEIGMSHLGMKILYHLLNEQEDIYCERAFAPWDDFEQQLKEHNLPLPALESGDGLDRFDFVGFTLQYEMCYTNVINMLSLGHIPLLSRDRKEGQPFVCAGGPCAFNPEPLADFIDFFMIGEGEEVMLEVMDAYRTWQDSAAPREAFLKAVAKLEGVYVPRFYDVSYQDDGTVAAVTPNCPEAAPVVKKRIIVDLDKVFYPRQMIVPFIDIVHDRIMLEVFRGCTHGCRFCQAGVIYRPVREKSAQTLTGCADALMEATGYEELSLTSLSTGDYSEFPQLTETLLEHARENRTNIALPSLRLDSVHLELIKKVQKERKSSFTFAPEAGTQRMRDVINKNISEEDLMASVQMAFENGWSSIKLYFMLGLPFETDADVSGIGELAHRALDQYYAIDRQKRQPGGRITVSVSSFIPKPFTPFQWAAQNSLEEIERKQRLVGEAIHAKSIKYNYHDSKTSRLEGVFARGDRRLSAVLYQAWRDGCRLDGWSEFFNYDIWMGAFSKCGIDPDFYTARERDFEEILPWDHISAGVSKDFLIREAKRAGEAKTTKGCLDACSKCGADCWDAGICKREGGLG